MSTRGTIGFVVNKEAKLCYNHSDSYPSWMGVHTLGFLREFLKENDVSELRRQAGEIRVVSDEGSPATPEEIARLRPYSNFHVHSYSVSGPPGGVLPTENVAWYMLLRETQGDWKLILEVGLMEDGSSFPLDSLFCEWAYVIDLDASTPQVEIYEGFQEKLPKKGRWAGRPTAAENKKSHEEHLKWCAAEGRDPWLPLVPKYKAVELVATYPLGDLPSDEAFLADVDPPDELTELWKWSEYGDKAVSLRNARARKLRKRGYVVKCSTQELSADLVASVLEAVRS